MLFSVWITAYSLWFCVICCPRHVVVAIWYMETSDKQEILEAISLLAEQVQGIADDVGTLKSDVGTLKSDMAKVKATMVTKSYLDEKLSDLRGDLVALARKSNTKLSVVIEELVMSGTLKREIADRILALEPFPVV